MSGKFGVSFVRSFLGQVCQEDVSAERILRQLHPEGPKCVSCRGFLVGKRAVSSFWAGRRTYCAACNTKFTPRSGTILQDSHISFSHFEQLLLCLALGFDYRSTASLIGLHEDTVKTWAAKIAFWESHA